MKYIPGIAAIILVVASPQVLAAPASCERVKSDIEQRIINNGVAESSFTLNIVPNDQADQPDSLVVGHCAMIRTKFSIPEPTAATPPPIAHLHKTDTSPNRNKSHPPCAEGYSSLICIKMTYS